MFLPTSGKALSPPFGLMGWRARVVAAQELKNLHAGIKRIPDVNAVLLVNVNSHGQVEGARRIAVSAYEHQDRSLGIEDLEVVEGGVHHPDVAFTVERHALRPRKVARLVPPPAEAPHKFEIRGKNLDRAASRVGDRKIAVPVHPDSHREVEFTVFSAPLTDRSDVLQRVQVVDQYLMEVAINHKKPAPDFIKRQQGRVLERRVLPDHGLQVAIAIELHDDVLRRV